MHRKSFPKRSWRSQGVREIDGRRLSGESVKVNYLVQSQLSEIQCPSATILIECQQRRRQAAAGWLPKQPTTAGMQPPGRPRTSRTPQKRLKAPRAPSRDHQGFPLSLAASCVIGGPLVGPWCPPPAHNLFQPPIVEIDNQIYQNLFSSNLNQVI